MSAVVCMHGEPVDRLGAPYAGYRNVNAPINLRRARSIAPGSRSAHRRGITGLGLNVISVAIILLHSEGMFKLETERLEPARAPSLGSGGYVSTWLAIHGTCAE